MGVYSKNKFIIELHRKRSSHSKDLKKASKLKKRFLTANNLKKLIKAFLESDIPLNKLRTLVIKESFSF
jgi:hypothetical protein